MVMIVLMNVPTTKNVPRSSRVYGDRDTKLYKKLKFLELVQKGVPVGARFTWSIKTCR